VIRDNLRRAEEIIAQERARREQERKLKEAEQKIHGMVGDLSKSLGTSAPNGSGSLEFMGSDKAPSSTEAIKEKSSGDLQFMDKGIASVSDRQKPSRSETPLRHIVTLKTIDVPSPFGFRSEGERRQQLAKLSDKQINAEIERSKKTLERMKTEFLNDPKALEACLEEMKDSERQALMAGFHLILGGSLVKWKKGWEAYPRLKSLAENGLRYLSYDEPAKRIMKNPDDQEAHQEMARVYMLDLYGTLRDFDEGLITKNGPPLAQFADFLVEYSYQVARWAIARDQVLTISKNLDKPNGKLKAQQAINQVMEDLIQERKRRAGQ